MKVKIAILIMLIFSTITSVATAANDNTTLIKASLQQFVTDWNNGNMNAAMNIYKEGEDTLLISDKMIKGSKNINQFWHDSYPTQASMGKMAFSDIEIKLLSAHYALAIGNWALQVPSEKNTGGIFSVLFEKTNHGWKSTVDHTTGL